MKYKSNRGNTEEYVGRQTKAYMESVANQYIRILDSKFTGPKGGRIYGRHQASAPGEWPGIATGALRKSVRRVIERTGRMSYRVRIGVTQQSGRSLIAGFLEFGTSRMRPRPSWRPALAELRARLVARGRR